jgi:hypothetical protein
LKQEIFEGADVFYAQSYTLKDCDEIKSLISESKIKGNRLKNLLDFIERSDNTTIIDLDFKKYIEKSVIRTYEQLIECSKIEEIVA